MVPWAYLLPFPVGLAYWALFPSFFLSRLLQPVIPTLFHFCHFLYLWPTYCYFRLGWPIVPYLFFFFFFFPGLLWSLLLVLVGLLATISYELVHWDLFISFFSSFYGPFAFVLLSNLLPLFFFACHWIFLLLCPFCKKRVSTMLYNTKKVTCLLTTHSTSSLSSKAIIV